MNVSEQVYDSAIIGGGLAGLSLAIQLADAGFKVVLLEKESFPFHKVCGEYVSLESYRFLQSLGLPLDAWKLPLIDKLMLTDADGTAFHTPLPLGGFGISRKKLDGALAELAIMKGVHVLQGAKVTDVSRENNFQIHFSHASGAAMAQSRTCCASFGKRSNLDIKWNRGFVQESKKHPVNYVAVKYHVKANWESNSIGLHNFKGGYCGISAIEDGSFCLCYMTRSENLPAGQHNISRMETAVFARNHVLKSIFEKATFLPGFPLVISQINFVQKSPVEKDILMLGDAAGTIPPLCGNGMSMALRSSRLAAPIVTDFLLHKIDEQVYFELYAQGWKKEFGLRIGAGRFLQHFFGKPALSRIFVNGFRLLPFLAKPVIRLTHGHPF